MALYPVALSLYFLAIIYRLRRGEYWSATWPIPFLLGGVLLPLGWFGRGIWRFGGWWWVQGVNDDGEEVRGGEDGDGGRGKMPSFQASVMGLVVVVGLVVGKWVEVGMFF